MSARKRKEKKAQSQAESQVEAAAPGLWPSEFVPIRSAVLAGICVAGWGLILAMLGGGNNLLGLKQAAMIIAGARLEPMLLLESMHSMDIAAVLFGFVLVLGAGYIHVSLGLAVLLAIRPWLDGYVYEVDNYYFVWAAMLLLAIWAIRQWSNPKSLHGLRPLGLFDIFWSCSLVAAVGGMQFDTSYRELILWAYYGVVFFLAIQATPDRVTRGVVLAGFLAGVAGQAIYAYPYLYYLLPFIREQMAGNPAMMSQFFDGVNEATAEIARRFNVNRAAASMLFPNALAALLILGIPVCLALAVNGWRRLRSRATAEVPRVTGFRYLLPPALALFAGVCFILFALGQLRLVYRPADPAWFGGLQGLAVGSVLAAAMLSGAFLLAARRLGLARVADWTGTLAAGALFPVALGALWITYSRGAMLALAVACAAGAWIVIQRRGGLKALRGKGLAAASVVGVAGLVLPLAVTGFAPDATAQDAAQNTGEAAPVNDEAPAGPDNTITREGIDVGLSDLANPASLGLRWSYWRVSVSMALDNWLTGVGPGNYKFAYPIYQYLGAGDVQNAHNGLLQAWCETGIFGALALVAFWAYLLWAGSRAIVRWDDPAAVVLGLGLLVGVLAFLLHALLDMNLSHPTLLTFAMVAAGILVRMDTPTPKPTRSGTRGQWVVVLAMALAAVVSGLALRPYLMHLGMNGGKFLHVGDQTMVERRFNTANFFLAECTGWALEGKREQPPLLPVRDVVTLLGERGQLFKLGRILVSDPATGETMTVPSDSYIPHNAWFQIRRPWDAHAIAFKRTQAWLAELERLDARSPYSPDIALHIASGYKLLVEQAGEKGVERRSPLLERMLDWGDEAIRRSPRRADIHQFMGWAYWTAGTFTSGRASLRHFENALASFQHCTRLVPNQASYQFAYAETLRAMGQSYENAGDADQAQAYFKRAADAQHAGEAIQRRRGALGLH